MQNKPGEPEFKLKIEPSDKISFKYKLGEPASIELKITNTTKDRQCYKVKCTSNEVFRVRPPIDFIKAGETAAVKVILTTNKEMANNHHFFAIYHIKFTDEKITARKAWTPASKPDGVIRIAASFELEKKEKEDEKKDEKNDEKKDAEKGKQEDDKKGADDKKEDEKKEEKKDNIDEKDKNDKDEKEEEKKEDKKEDKKEEKKDSKDGKE